MLSQNLIHEHASLLKPVYFVTDMLCIFTGCWLAYWLYLDGEDIIFANYVAVSFIAVLVAAPVLPRFGVYDVQSGSSFLAEIKKLMLGWLTVIILLVFFAFITKYGASFSRAWTVLWIVVSGSLLILSRLVYRLLVNWLYKKGYGRKTVIIIGDPQHANAILNKLALLGTSSFKYSGFYSTTNSVTDLPANIVYKGNIIESSDNAQIDADQIWIALSLKDEELVKTIMHKLRHSMANIRYFPDIYGFRLINHSISNIGSIPVINLSISPMDPAGYLLKLIADFVLSLLILVISSPLFLTIALLVKFTSPGPVFFKQQRVGWNGKRFTMYKFRSMPVNNTDDTAKWGSKNKPTTAVGSILRKTSLDELPQFINVLKGEMSIVGPRPELPRFVEKLKDEIPDYMKKHLVKAGITGWAQVNGWRGETDINKRIEYDLFYIENWSFWFDIKIILLTLFRGFISRNAY